MSSTVLMPKPPRKVEMKTREEISLMRQAGAVVAGALTMLKKSLSVGMSTKDIDVLAMDYLSKNNAQPAFLGYRGFPASICVSINSEVVHGIPSPKRKIADGDIVSLDFGCVIGGFYADAAVTAPVGNVSEEALRLIQVTEESLERGIAAALVGNRLGDIGFAVQSHCEKAGFSVVYDFVGHGIGRALHEEPQVPNYGKKGTGMRLVSGMVLAIEPMVNAGGSEVKVLDDQWTAVTKDGRLSAHFEHTVALTEKGPEILTQ